MCGTCGIVSFDPGQAVPSEDLLRVRDVPIHRGRDDAGILVEQGVGLGHRRLSILDLSERAGKPMCSAIDRPADLRNHLGTCRMGDDPRAGVTNRDLKVHDCPNIFLCGSEVFVTGAAVPPVLTLVGLAHRLSDHLEHRLDVG